jgi:hypothetical protein
MSRKYSHDGRGSETERKISHRDFCDRLGENCLRNWNGGGVSKLADFLKKHFGVKNGRHPSKPAVAFWLCCGGYSYPHVQSGTRIRSPQQSSSRGTGTNAARIDKLTPNRQQEKIKTGQMYELRRSAYN